MKFKFSDGLFNILINSELSLSGFWWMDRVFYPLWKLRSSLCSSYRCCASKGICEGINIRIKVAFKALDRDIYYDMISSSQMTPSWTLKLLFFDPRLYLYGITMVTNTRFEVSQLILITDCRVTLLLEQIFEYQCCFSTAFNFIVRISKKFVFFVV